MLKVVMLDRVHIIVTAHKRPHAQHNVSVLLAIRIALIFARGVKHSAFMNKLVVEIRTALMLIETALLAKLCVNLIPKRKRKHALFLC